MYEAYWQIQRKPFEETAEESFYYPGESHQGALLKLRYAIESRRGAAVLAGASGLGKTLLVRMLDRMLPETFTPFAHVVFPKMPPDQFVAYLATELGAAGAGDASEGIAQTVSRIQRFVVEASRQGRHPVVAVDEAHLLDQHDSLEILRLLLNFEIDGAPGMTLVLVGQPRLLPTLDRNPGLEERVGVKCLLRPLNLEETMSYVHHRLKAAGAQRAIFETDGLEALFHITHGAPRQINRLCDLALLIGYAEELPSLGAEQIESVSEELVTVSPE